jgi:hypothetical protein
MQPKLHLHYKNHGAGSVTWVAYMLGSYSYVNNTTYLENENISRKLQKGLAETLENLYLF